MNRNQTMRRAGLAAAAVSGLAALLLSGCVAAPPPRAVAPPAPPPPAPNTQVYAYPLHGQTPEQQDRDHYECSQWATQQTGFDPSAPGVPPHDRVQVVSAGPPPGTNTALGVFTGALIGAAIGGWNPAPAMFAGALVGGAIGSSADAANAHANAQAAGLASAQYRSAAAAQEQQAAQYRRAVSACLDGRGYSVK